MDEWQSRRRTITKHLEVNDSYDMIAKFDTFFSLFCCTDV
jgi:hypothetical protein